MSEFDEEAERERLREQYEQDQEKRQTTERMSELLLKGATMTDNHCGSCGDPIFRYDGQEFCPTCQKVVGEGDDSTETDEDAEQSTEDQAEKTPEAEDSEPAEGESQKEDPADTPATETEDSPRAVESTPTATPEHTGRPDIPPASGDLSEARSSLVATLEKFAERAQSTDDPSRATDNLEAAREAAETIVALDRIR